MATARIVPATAARARPVQATRQSASVSRVMLPSEISRIVGRKRRNAAAAHGRGDAGGRCQTRGMGGGGLYALRVYGREIAPPRRMRGPKLAGVPRRSPERAVARRSAPPVGVALGVGLALPATGIASAGLGR